MQGICYSANWKGCVGGGVSMLEQKGESVCVCLCDIQEQLKIS